MNVMKISVCVSAAVLLLFLSGSTIEIPQNTIPIQEQWKNSHHAMSMDSPEKSTRMNTPECAHCHTAQGYWEVILEGKESTAPYEDALGLSCEACHFVDQIKDGHAALRSGAPERACTGCHDILVQNDEEGFSSCLQGAMLRGEGGEEFEGRKYETSAHSQVDKSCVGCHMAQVSDNKHSIHVGGHTFRVITKQKTPRIFNPAGCLICHDSMTFDEIEKSQNKILILMDALREHLPKDKGEPRFPKDPSLSLNESKAAYNYYFILKDGTSGLHNPIYIRKLLEDSIAALKGEGD